MSPGAVGSQGEGDSHDRYTWEPTRSSWDAGVLPRIVPITQTGYSSILGIPGEPRMPVLLGDYKTQDKNTGLKIIIKPMRKTTIGYDSFS